MIGDKFYTAQTGEEFRFSGSSIDPKAIHKWSVPKMGFFGARELQFVGG
jgi:hypothetical protein